MQLKKSTRNGFIVISVLLFIGITTVYHYYGEECEAQVLQKRWVTTKAGSDVEDKPSVMLQKSELDGCSFEVEIPGFNIEKIEFEGEQYDRIRVPSIHSNDRIGHPEIPVFVYRIAIPACEDVTVTVTPLESIEIKDIELAPVPRLSRREDYIIRERFIKDKSVYSTEELYPEMLFIVNSNIKIRGQRIAEVTVHPFRYNPLTKILSVTTKLKITTHNELAVGPICQNTGPFTNICKSLLVNYDLSAPPLSRISLGATAAEWNCDFFYCDDRNCVPSNTDYLIVLADQFYDDPVAKDLVCSLAEKRVTHNGFNVAIIKCSGCQAGYSGDADSTLRNGLKDIYENSNGTHMQDGKLGFILLIGDVADPNEIEYIPTHFLSEAYATDHFFELLDGEDNYSDVFIGRLSVDDNNELGAVVDKIVNYEYPDPEWAGKCLLVSGDLEGISSRDDEELFNEWKDMVIDNLSNAFICDELHRVDMDDVDFGNWGGKNPNSQQTKDFGNEIANRLNEGRSMMFFIGHGVKPYLNISFYPWHFEDESKLNNSNMYPFIVTYSCHTGRYDEHNNSQFYCPSDAADPNEVGQYGPAAPSEVDPCDCFAERIINIGNRGAIAVLAPSREHLYPIHESDFLDIFSNYYYEPIGYYATMAYLVSPTSNMHKNMNLLGDPALNIYLKCEPGMCDEKIELAMAEILEDEPLLLSPGSYSIMCKVKNAGYNTAQNFKVAVLDGPTELGSIIVETLLPYHDTVVEVPFNISGINVENVLTVAVNPYQEIDEIDYANNSRYITVYIYDQQPDYPLVLDGKPFTILTLSKLDNDINKELVFSTQDNKLMACDYQGNIKQVNIVSEEDEGINYENVPVGFVTQVNTREAIYIGHTNNMETMSSVMNIHVAHLVDNPSITYTEQVSFNAPIDYVITALYDCDCDGRDELIAAIGYKDEGLTDNTIEIFDYDVSLSRFIRKILPQSQEGSFIAMAVDDIDFDNSPEIALLGFDRSPTYPIYNKIYLKVIDYNDCTQFKYDNSFDLPVYVYGNLYGNILFEDVNNDYYKDIIACFPLKLVVIDGDLDDPSEDILVDHDYEIESDPYYFRANITVNCVLVGDYIAEEEETVKEFYFQDDLDRFSCFTYDPSTHTFERQHAYTFQDNVHIMSPLSADIDNDNEQEIIIPYTYTGTFYITEAGPYRVVAIEPDLVNVIELVNGLNAVELGYLDDRDEDKTNYPQFAVANFDDDNNYELIVTSLLYKTVHMINLDVTGDEEIAWPHRNGNEKHTNSNLRYVAYNGGGSMSLWNRISLIGDVYINASSNLFVSRGTEILVHTEDLFGTGTDTARCEMIIEGDGYFRGVLNDSIYVTSGAAVESAGDWYGVVLTGNNAHINMRYCNVSDAYIGVESNGTNSKMIENSTFSNCEYAGVKISSVGGSNPTTVRYSYLNSNSTYGIEINGCNDANINNCVCKMNGISGIHIYNSDITVQYCLFENNNLYGIVASGSDPNIVECTAKNNSYSGIFYYNSGGIVQESGINDNGQYGIWCIGSGSNPEIKDTAIKGNNTGVLVSMSGHIILGDVGTGQGQMNSIDNTTYNVNNSVSGYTVMAEGCWWGDMIPDESKFIGSIDYIPCLIYDPIQYYRQSPRESARVLSLRQNFPNPLTTGTTTIMYSIPRNNERVALRIYDVSGRLVKTLVDKVQGNGHYRVTWDGHNHRGDRVASGIYFYRLVVGQEVLTKKIILLR